jgi:hypothetical protein
MKVAESLRSMRSARTWPVATSMAATSFHAGQAGEAGRSPVMPVPPEETHLGVEEFAQRGP